VPKKEKPPARPDDLVRAAAGAYRSGDGRFEVQKSDQGWFLVDTEQANEFGQQLIHGPLATLDDVRVAIPGARDIKPLLRSAKRPTPAAGAAAAAKAAAKSKPKPLSWIDRLSKTEAAEVRRLIAALEKEGITDAEALVKRDRSSDVGLVAAALIEQRLRAATDRPTARRVAEILTDEGATTARPLPRWELVEMPRDPAQPPRKIRLRP
jgi:hypothetical protein